MTKKDATQFALELRSLKEEVKPRTLQEKIRFTVCKIFKRPIIEAGLINDIQKNIQNNERNGLIADVSACLEKNLKLKNPQISCTFPLDYPLNEESYPMIFLSTSIDLEGGDTLNNIQYDRSADTISVFCKKKDGKLLKQTFPLFAKGKKSDRSSPENRSEVKEVSITEAIGGVANNQNESLKIFERFFLNLFGLLETEDQKKEYTFTSETKNGKETYTLKCPPFKKEGISGASVVDSLSLGFFVKNMVGSQKATVEFPSSLSFTVDRTEKDVVTISLNRTGPKSKDPSENIVLKMGTVNAKLATLSYNTQTKEMMLETEAILLDKKPNAVKLDLSQGDEAPAFKLFKEIHTKSDENKTSIDNSFKN